MALAMRQLAGRRAAVLVSFQSERVWSFDGADLDTIAFEERAFSLRRSGQRRAFA